MKERGLLLNPIALDELGRSIRIDDPNAGKGRRFCVECRKPMIYRHGLKNQAHFAHKRNNNTCGLSTGEGREHSLASRRIFEEGVRYLRGECSVPQVTFEGETLPLPAFASVKLEKTLKLDANKRRRPDVVFLDAEGNVSFFIEVYCTNAVNRARAIDLRGVPGVEILASTVLAGELGQNPVTWDARVDLGFFGLPILGTVVDESPEESQFAEAFTDLLTAGWQSLSGWWKSQPEGTKTAYKWVGGLALASLIFRSNDDADLPGLWG